MSGLRITYSLADQSFAKTKSIGIFNLSLGLAREFQLRPEVERLDVLTNSTLIDLIPTAANTGIYNHDVALKGQLGRMKWDQWDVYAAARRRDNEWLFLPKGFASFVHKPPVKLASCVADTIHDFYHVHHPKAVSRLEARYFQRSLRATIKRSAVIFTISEFTRDEVLRVADKLGMKPPPVIHAGIGFQDAAGEWCTNKAGVVVLAGRFPHKLTARMVEWLDRWQRKTKFGEPIDWIGALPDGINLPNHANWRMNPRLSEAEYRAKIAEARALVFASEYEGFGMPPVEATIAGTVPVYSSIPATGEIMGNSGVSFSNEDYASFAESLSRSLEIKSEEIIEWKRELLARHDWQRVTDRIISGLTGK